VGRTFDEQMRVDAGYDLAAAALEAEIAVVAPHVDRDVGTVVDSGLAVLGAAGSIATLLVGRRELLALLKLAIVGRSVADPLEIEVSTGTRVVRLSAASADDLEEVFSELLELAEVHGLFETPAEPSG